MFASKSTRGFYDPEIHTTMPDDVVEITKEQHIALLDGQSAGKVISWDKKGFPVLTERPAPTKDELNAAADAGRQAAYAAEADPLFYQYQRDDIEKQVWLDKIAEIKARFPKV